MLTNSQVMSLETKGLVYYRANGRDFAIDPRTILEKKSELQKQGLDVARFDGKIEPFLVIAPREYFSEPIYCLSAIPLYISMETLKPIRPLSFYAMALFPGIGEIEALDFSDCYFRASDLGTARSFLVAFKRVLKYIKFSRTLDTPEIESLHRLLSDVTAFEIDFGDFTGKYIIDTSGMFEGSVFDNLRWDHVTFPVLKTADSMFRGVHAPFIDLSRFPSGVDEMNCIFQDSDLPIYYTEEDLKSGELQEWCSRNIKHCENLEKSKVPDH